MSHVSFVSPRPAVVPSPPRSEVPSAYCLVPSKQSLQALRLWLPSSEPKALILIKPEHQIHVTNGLPSCTPS